MGPAALDAIIDALAANTRVEALYIQNCERVRFPAKILGLWISVG